MSEQPGESNVSGLACEVCGETVGVGVYGTDYTPLCPAHAPEEPRSYQDLADANAALLARLEQKDQAIRVLCHDLRGSLAALVTRAQLLERCLERGMVDRAAEHAIALRELLGRRKAIIDAAQDEALRM